jgi:hypothetical protein
MRRAFVAAISSVLIRNKVHRTMQASVSYEPWSASITGLFDVDVA